MCTMPAEQRTDAAVFAKLHLNINTNGKEKEIAKAMNNDPFPNKNKQIANNKKFSHLFNTDL